MNLQTIPPTTLEAGATGGGWIVVGHTGAHSDPGRYGEFEITPAMVASWQRNPAR
jgi:hypothetical protein